MKITLDEKTHTYRDEKGVVVPNVTSIINASFPFKYSDDHAMQRGSMVHLACDLIDVNDLDWNTVNSEIKGYVEGYAKFLSEVAPVYVGAEEIVYNKKLNYCGTLDRRTARILYDIKTGGKYHTHAMQLAAYCEALGLKLKMRGLYLKSNGKYEVITYDGRIHFYNFLAVLRIFQIKKREGLI